MATTVNQSQSNPVYPIMVAIGVCHLINDTMQSVIPAMFPLLERDLELTFTQLGMISFVLNIYPAFLLNSYILMPYQQTLKPFSLF